MLNIMKADFYRIKKGKGVYICLLAIIALCSVSIYLKSPGHMGLNGGITSSESMQEMDSSTTMEDVRELAGNDNLVLDEGMMQVNGNLYYVMIFVVFTILCVDLSNHTAKNVISSNVSRTTYYLSKLVSSWILGILLLAFSTYFGYFGNIVFNQPNNVSSILDITIIMIRQIPIFCGIISVLVMIAILSRKTARYNGVAIALVMGVQMLLSLLVMIFHIDGTAIMQFEFEAVVRSVAVVGGISWHTLLVAMFSSVVMIVIPSVIGIRYFNTCDIR